MALLHQVGEELEEEREQQQAYVHAVDVGIGGDDHVVVAQAVEAVLDVERGLQKIELLVFVDNLACQAERVERLAAQREHGLGLHIADLGNGA